MIYDLSRSNLFAGISLENIDRAIKNWASVKSYKKGQFIFTKGEKPEYMFILLKGSLTVFSDDINGKRELLAFFKEAGVLFAEVYLYLKKQTYHFSAVAEEDVKLLVISRDFFKNAMDDKEIGNQIMENYLNILSEKLYFFNEKIRILSAFSLRQKLARYILGHSDKLSFELDFNREDLADYLGTTRPSVSRELNKMQEEGLLEINRSKVKILKLEELKTYL